MGIKKTHENDCDDVNDNDAITTIRTLLLLLLLLLLLHFRVFCRFFDAGISFVYQFIRKEHAANQRNQTSGSKEQTPTFYALDTHRKTHRETHRQTHTHTQQRVHRIRMINLSG